MSNLIRINKVEEKTGFSRSTIYLYVRDGLFPKPVKLGPRASAWVEDEIDAWIDERIKERGEQLELFEEYT